MKKIVFIAVAVMLATVLKAENAKYFQKMGETLAQYSQCKSVEDFQNLANKFKIIGGVEKSEWLPLYYEAHCYIIMSFITHNDAIKKDAYLDIAEPLFDKMIKMAPDESEIYTLRAFYYTARLVVNPQERGQKYSILSLQTVGKALAIEPDNPRAQLIKLQDEMGTARFFGKDVTTYYAQAEQLLNSWDNYKPKSAIYPNWGKDQVQDIVNEQQSLNN